MVKVNYFLKTDLFLNYNPLKVWKYCVTHIWTGPPALSSSSLKTKLISIKISVLMNRSFCIIFFIFTENTWKLIIECFQAWCFYGLKSFRFLYNDHTISSVTRENVAFTF